MPAAICGSLFYATEGGGKAIKLVCAKLSDDTDDDDVVDYKDDDGNNDEDGDDTMTMIMMMSKIRVTKVIIMKVMTMSMLEITIMMMIGPPGPPRGRAGFVSIVIVNSEYA